MKKALIAFALFSVALFLAPLLRAQSDQPASTQKVVFAGGCFWCMQPPFDHAPGVISTIVGYAGGGEENPTYGQVSSGKTGHQESIEVTYDPAKISYEKLLDIYWHNIRPTQGNGQFVDVGNQYKPIIFYSTDEQKKIAEESKEKLAKSGKFKEPIAVKIEAATKFWPAEDYHQKYYLKKPDDYEAYHVGSGRVGYLKRTWGDTQ